MPQKPLTDDSGSSSLPVLSPNDPRNALMESIRKGTTLKVSFIRKERLNSKQYYLIFCLKLHRKLIKVRLAQVVVTLVVI